jgi:ParB family chromosome partitioning protein
MVDGKDLAFSPAVELSFLSQDQQADVLSLMEKYGIAPSLSQAQRLKKFSQDNKFTADIADAILSEDKTVVPPLKLSGMSVRKYFPESFSAKQMEATIIELLEKWHSQQNMQNELMNT